jgi:hypothetical protein
MTKRKLLCAAVVAPCLVIACGPPKQAEAPRVAYDASKDPPKPAEWRCYQVKPKGEDERSYCFAQESECKDAHSATVRGADAADVGECGPGTEAHCYQLVKATGEIAQRCTQKADHCARDAASTAAHAGTWIKAVSDCKPH